MLILEDYENARRRGAEIHAEIIGYGSTADAFRVTDMHEEGRGPGAALGIVAVLIVGIATYISHRVIDRTEKRRSAGGITVADPVGAA